VDDRVRRGIDRERWAIIYARIALGAAFLSAMASRFGLWGGGSFDGFVAYTAAVNSFMPPVTIPFLGWAATIAELERAPSAL
jgi:hypothetical protein